MQHINNNGSCIALLGLLLLKTILYFTALFYVKSIVFSKVIMLPSGHGVRERPLGVLPDITNIRNKHTAVFNTSSSIGFNLGLLPQPNPCHLLTVSILY